MQQTQLSTITTASTLAATTFCIGSSVSVPFTVSGTVSANQTFTAELSDATGSFVTPTAIGSVAASAAGSYTIAATIPATAPAGTAYRIWVASSSPVILGNANNANLTIKALPTATLTETAAICAGTGTTLSVALTGTGPWALTYTDGTTPVTVNNIVASPYTFSVNPSSTRTYTLTAVADAACAGTAFTGSALVIVNPKPDPAEIVVTPSNRVYTGGVPTNLYLGYGPQQVTLKASGGGSYSWTGPAGLSSTTASNPVFTAQTSGVFAYTVTITNASGCTATKQITITVLDVRCGIDKKTRTNKVLICLLGRVVCITEYVVPPLLLYTRGLVVLGSCNPTANIASTSDSADAFATDNSLSATEQLNQPLEAFPNLFTERATLRFRSAKSAPAQLQVYNQLGQLVATPFNGVTEAGKQYDITLEGSSLPEGIYTCRLLTDGKAETIRLVLVK